MRRNMVDMTLAKNAGRAIATSYRNEPSKSEWSGQLPLVAVPHLAFEHHGRAVVEAEFFDPDEIPRLPHGFGHADEAGLEGAFEVGLTQSHAGSLRCLILISSELPKIPSDRKSSTAIRIMPNRNSWVPGTIVNSSPPITIPSSSRRRISIRT